MYYKCHCFYQNTYFEKINDSSGFTGFVNFQSLEKCDFDNTVQNW
jgi:hypothetical protein